MNLFKMIFFGVLALFITGSFDNSFCTIIGHDSAKHNAEIKQNAEAKSVAEIAAQYDAKYAQSCVKLQDLTASFNSGTLVSSNDFFKALQCFGELADKKCGRGGSLLEPQLTKPYQSFMGTYDDIVAVEKLSTKYNITIAKK